MQTSALWCCPSCQAQNPAPWARCWRCDAAHPVKADSSYTAALVVGVVTVLAVLGVAARLLLAK